MEQHKLSKEEKQSLVLELNHLFGEVMLKVDGNLVCAQRRRISESKLEIAVFVNGKLDWGSIINKDEGIKKFYRPVKKYLYTKSFRDKFKKKFGIRAAKREKIDDQYVVYLPTFTSAKSFVSHLEKNNESIEIITHDQYETQREIQNKENV